MMIKEEEIAHALKSITTMINNSEQIKKISHLVDIKTSVVGGAIRDLLLNQPIKDIDVAITLNFNKNLNVQYSQRNYNAYSLNREVDDEYYLLQQQSDEAQALKLRGGEIIDLLKTSEFSNIHTKLNELSKPISAVDAVIALIEQVIRENRDYHLHTIFDSVTFEKQKTLIEDCVYKHTTGLHAVLGITSTSINYPIELLFTTDNVDNFIKVFDFNLCKTYMVNNHGTIEIVQSKEFIDDVKNKTMTYSPMGEMTQDKIEKSLLVRYPRLYNKFPDYQLIAYTRAVTSEFATVIEESVETINLFNKLNKQTANKSSKNKTNKL
jgi:hypothetical protein